MTNRDKLIRLLEIKDNGICDFLICPYTPGEKEAGCKDPEFADHYKDCIPCLRGWLRKKAK